jgi:hypothetical protein
MHTKAAPETRPADKKRQGSFFQSSHSGGFFGKTTDQGDGFFGKNQQQETFISRSPVHSAQTGAQQQHTTTTAVHRPIIQRQPVLPQQEEQIQRRETTGEGSEILSGASFAATPPDDTTASGAAQTISTPVRQTGHTLIQRDELPASQATASDPLTPQTDALAPLPQSSGTGPRRIRVDALGQDVNVNEPLAYAAANTLGTDIRVMSLEDLVTQLEQMTAGGACIESLTIWHHGSPGSQLVNGMYTIQPRGSSGNPIGTPYRLPQSGFNISWLTTPGNQPVLNRFRRVFCCNARMHWIGCMTVGIHAQGGLRTQQEQRTTPFRSLVAPSSYRDAADVQQHGASLYGATFGEINAQLWANALCIRVVASREIVHIDPGTTTPAVRVPEGALSVFSPQNPQSCACDTATGRTAGAAPSVEEIVANNQALEQQQMEGLDINWHHLLRAFRSYVAVINPPNLVASGWATAGRSRERDMESGTLQDRVQQEVRAGRPGQHTRDAMQAFYAILQYAASTLTPPAPLPNTVFDAQHRPFISFAQPSYTYAAVTFPHLAICYPNNFWRWMMFNDIVIGQTPEYTRSVIYHEMEHAADILRSLQQFEAAHGPAPAPPPDISARCRPINEGVRQGWTDPWGQYVNNFVNFYNGSLPPNRHLQIVVNQAAMGIDRWSNDEKIQWVRNLLTYVPGDLAAADTLTGEAEVMRLYTQGDAHLREVMIDEFTATFNDISRLERDMGGGGFGAATTSLAEQRQQLEQMRARGRTILNHFAPIVTEVIRLHFFNNRRVLETLTGMRRTTSVSH